MQTFAAILALAGLAAAQTGGNAQATGTGVSPVGGSCQADFQICGSSGTSAETCSNARDVCISTCSTRFEACRSPTNAGVTNEVTCTAAYAVCLGYNPFANGNNVVTITAVVPSFVTYCPAATQFVTNGQTYTANGPTTLTVTDCPCTVTRAVTSVPNGASTPGSNAACSGSGCSSGNNGGSGGSGNTTGGYTPVPFKGAANPIAVAGLSGLAAGIGALAFFL